MVAGLDRLDNCVMVEEQARKFGLNLRIEKTKVATRIWQQKFLESCKKNIFLDKILTRTSFLVLVRILSKKMFLDSS